MSSTLVLAFGIGTDHRSLAAYLLGAQLLHQVYRTGGGHPGVPLQLLGVCPEVPLQGDHQTRTTLLLSKKD